VIRQIAEAGVDLVSALLVGFEHGQRDLLREHRVLPPSQLDSYGAASAPVGFMKRRV